MATLSVNEILQDTLDAFAVMVPMIESFSTDMSSRTARKDDTIIMHVASLPSVQSYDNTSGFQASPTAESSDLIADVTVALDQLKHVPVRTKYLTALASKKNLYREQIRNNAYVLGKKVVDDVLSKITSTNFTHGQAISVANTTYDSVEIVRTQLNSQGAALTGRFGIVTSGFAQALQVDARVGSRDYYGQLNGDNGYRTFRNVAGFGTIWEYPDLLTAASGNLSGFFCDRRALQLATRIPDVQSDSSGLNVPQIARFQVATHPESGLSLLGITWQVAGTFDIWHTATLLYGMNGGTAGGSADAKVDKAGYRVTTV